MVLGLSDIYLQLHFSPEIPVESYEQPYSISFWRTHTQTDLLHDYIELSPAPPRSWPPVDSCAFLFFLQLDCQLLDGKAAYTEVMQ